MICIYTHTIDAVRGSTLTEAAHPVQAPQQEALVKNMKLISHHQPEEFRKGQKETPHV